MRIQRITTASEAQAERVLRRSLEGSRWAIALQLPVQVVLTKDADYLPDEDFDLYRMGRFDFTVYREVGHEPAFVIEFDGFGHERPEQIRRDITKNRLCAMAGLPLIRIGSDALREPEEVTVLEWLANRFVGWHVAYVDANLNGPPLEPAVRELTLSLFHHIGNPFPGNLAIAKRLFERFGIATRMRDFETVEVTPLASHWLSRAFGPVWSTAPYQLEVLWPGDFPTFKDGTASEIMVGTVGVALRARSKPKGLVHEETGTARFAWAHKTRSPISTPEHPLIPSEKNMRELGISATDLPWLDPSAVVDELAIYDALSRVERWALLRGRIA